MRPVRLDINGFASFREPAVVDFTDADYFALVGPTGSGKSTVIDAMTFALYGTAPRWGNRNAIADALAPTTNRCTVRLLFDLGPTRYVVAREVRRVGKVVQQKGAVLERLADPTGTEADGEAPGEVLAGDPREVTDTVEKLLGLSFSDFCQCIVLPQGQFADFLAATPKARQGILLKLLGADQYEAIGKASAQRSAVAEQKATMLTAQLEHLAEATEEAEDAAREHEVALAALAITVDETLPAIAAAAASIEAASQEHQRLTSERELLAGLAAPKEVAHLQAAVDAAVREHLLAVEAEATAVERDSAARSALAAGPNRGRLEQVLERRKEQAELSARRPGLVKADTAAQRREVQAAELVEVESDAVRQARERHDQARTAQSSAQAALAGLEQSRADLVAVRTPVGIDHLGARTSAAREAVRSGRAAREQAEIGDQQARDALSQAPSRGPLEQALKDLTERQRTEKRLAVLSSELETLKATVRQATEGVEAARAAVLAARAAQQAAGAASAAATLRPHLVAGEECPVCAQTVATLPPPLDLPEVAEATDRVTRTEHGLDQAQARLGDVSRQEAAKDAETRSTKADLDRLATALRGHPDDPAQLAAELTRLDTLADAVQQHGRELAAARLSERAAVDALAELDDQTAAARTRLRGVHGPLIAAGAPDLDDGDLPAAWQTLTTWTTAQVATLDTDRLPSARQVSATAAAEFTTAQQALSATETRQTRAHAGYTAAVKAAEHAAGALRGLTERLAELDTQLAASPTATEAIEQLAACTRLEAETYSAEQALLAARKAQGTAEDARGQWDSKAAQARRDLRTARDRLVALGAPAVDDADVAAAWADLIAWSGAQADARAAQLPAAAERIEAARAARDHQFAALLALIRDHQIDVPETISAGNSAGNLPALLASSLERARNRTTHLAQQRARAGTLTQDLASAREQQQVAKLLADLLRSDKFPRWLAAAALDTLVEDASAALFDLSGGQFDLAHERGEFIVIDHTDADSIRSVRTLSGGETFQASLALALALSAQLSTLAAEGAAHLDSIFLDEGFGTLDPDTLEVVAATLENLAHGERMVGVITHVAALADRAPVRFVVHRDNRSSTITREGA